MLEHTGENDREIFKDHNPIMIVLRELKLDHLWKDEYYEIVRGMLNCLQPV